MPYSKYSEQEVLNQAFDDTRLGLRVAPMSTSLKAQMQIVNTTAVLLPPVPLAKRQLLVIRPAADIAIGGDNTVTTANGFTIPANTTFELEVSENVTIYAIAGAGVTVRILEVA